MRLRGLYLRGYRRLWITVNIASTAPVGVGQHETLTCMTNSGVVNLDSNFMSLGRSDFDVLDAQVLAGVPGHCGLACNCLIIVSACKVPYFLSFQTPSLGQRAYLSNSRCHCLVEEARVE